MELKEVKALIDLVTKNELSEFELEQEGFKIRIKKGGLQAVLAPALAAPAAAPAYHPPPAAAPAQGAAPSAAPASTGKEILSPMVGTFYRSPSPDSPSYVEIGQAVTEDTVVGIIEAMKVMNEIKAETKGVISEILAENGKAVDFGKPLFRIKPA